MDSKLKLKAHLLSLAVLAFLSFVNGESLWSQETQLPTTANPAGQLAPLASPVKSQEPLKTEDIKTREVSTGSASADPSHLPAPVPAGRRTIGVALEGGGALGLAHIGALKWMEEHHVPVDRIAGTSMGCLVSALYASGHSTQQMQEITENGIFSQVLTLSTSYSDASFRRKQDAVELPQAITFGLKKGLGLRNSLLTDAGLNNFLQGELIAYNRKGIDFNKLPIPLRCVATDLNTMKPVVFSGGALPIAVRASIAIPGVFAPVVYDGHYLVDGAIMNNLPTDIVKNDLHSDVVIAIHLESPAFVEGDVSSIVGIFARAYSAGTALNERRGEALADVLISADTKSYSTADYGKATELIAVGYKAAEQHREQLLPYALKDADWEDYLAARYGRKRSLPGLLRAIRVEGQDSSAAAFVAHDLEELKGKPIDPKQISSALIEAQADGSMITKYETFAPGDSEGKATTDSFSSSSAAMPDTGLLVQLMPIKTGPPFLLFGPELIASTSNVTRGILDFRVIDQNFGGFGSELRADVRVGFLTHMSAEYYRRLTASNYFLKPHLRFTRQPIYIWENQERIAEQFQQQAGGGLDFGRTINNHLQIRAEWEADVMRWKLTSGKIDSPNISGIAHTGMLRVAYDTTQSGMVSPRGMRIDFATGALVNAPLSETAPTMQFNFNKANTFFKTNLIDFSLASNTYFRANVSQPFRFTLGGPFRLFASSIDEYRGTDTVLVRAAYLRQIAALPSGLGQGLYAVLSYEGGEVWSPEKPSFLRQDAVMGFAAATPLGAITFGTSIGDAGRRKVFFTLGRLF